MTPEIFVQMALKAWNTQINNTSKFFDSIDVSDYNREIAPGKNSIHYLIGHLLAVNDGMITLFGLGERQFAHLDEAFLKNADRSGLATPDAATLKDAWQKSNAVLTGYFNAMTPADWFGKHTAMSDQDLVVDPGRNKLSVLINRTNHVAYHYGQLVLAKAK
jgi:DinB family protein